MGKNHDEEAQPQETIASDEKVAPVTGQDRVASLSIASDGTLDQNNPAIIGDPETAKAIAKKQFGEQAAAAVDEAHRRTTEPEVEQKQDPTIQELKDKQDAAIADAEKKAEAVVDQLAEG